MPWYNAGTVTVTNNSVNVTGAGTAWVDNVRAGQSFVGPDGLAIEIASVVSATSLTLARAYRGATAAGQSYSIMPVQGDLRDLALSAAQLVQSFVAVRDGPGQGIFPGGSVGTPGIRFSGDEDTGIWRVGANILGLVTNGTERLRVDGNGAVGVGVTPSSLFHIGGRTTPELKITSSDAGSWKARVSFGNGSGTKWEMGTDIGNTGNHNFYWYDAVAGAERLRLDAAGNLGLGMGSNTSFKLDVYGSIGLKNNEAVHNRNNAGNFTSGTAGGWMQYGSDNNYYWDNYSGNFFIRGSGYATRVSVTSVDLAVAVNVVPTTDNARQIGWGGGRFTQIFAVTGTINTSDLRDKLWHGFAADLKVKLRRIADNIMAELGWFQFLDQIEEKGEHGARWHFGTRAQTVWGFVADEGLCAPLVGEGAEQRPDPEWTGPPPPAFLCWDVWADRFEPIMEEQQVDTETVTIGQEPTGLLDAHGQAIMRSITEERPVMSSVEVGQKLVQAAGNRFGLRIDQMGLLLDWAQGERDKEKDAAIADLSARLEALEAA